MKKPPNNLLDEKKTMSGLSTTKYEKMIYNFTRMVALTYS